MSIPEEKKLELVLKLIKQEGAEEELCAEYGVDPQQALIWKKEFLEAGIAFFSKDPPVIGIWKQSLRKLLAFYDSRCRSRKLFFPMLFIFFLLLNISCYWLGVSTAFSELLRGDDSFYYFKIQFPVGFLGALFDSFSFYVTLFIIRRALKTRTVKGYLSHLSIDFIIALAATAWVLFVFWFSGWLIGLTETEPQLLAQRTETYEKLIVEVVKNPWAGWRNIYFGIIMGFSTMIPTSMHIFMFLKSLFKFIRDES